MDSSSIFILFVANAAFWLGGYFAGRIAERDSSSKEKYKDKNEQIT